LIVSGYRILSFVIVGLIGLVLLVLGMILMIVGLLHLWSYWAIALSVIGGLALYASFLFLRAAAEIMDLALK
jgi:hypothetical protein